MKTVLRNVLYLALVLCWSVPALAQLELSAFTATGRGVATTFTTDYQTIGINPANLGFRKSFRDPMLTVGFMEFNASFFSEALSRGELARSVFNPRFYNFSPEEKEQAVERFSNRALSINLDAMLFGISVSLPKWGGFAFSIRDRVQYFSRLNREVSQILFLGHNSPYFTDLLLSNGRIISNTPGLSAELRDQVVAGFTSEEDARIYSDLLDGSRISSSWYREFNLSYGVKLIDQYNFALHAGAGVKLINGIALIDLLAEGGQLIQDNISMSPTFGLDFGNDLQVSNPSFVGLNRSASNIDKLLGARPVGRGLGLDLGINMVIKRNFYLGIAANNIGGMRWTGNAYRLNDGLLREIQGTGVNTFNILATSESSLQFAGDKSPLQWQGTNEITQQLPSVVRIGGSYEYFRTFHIGFDVIIPANRVAGNIEQPIYAIGGDYRINRWLKISSGINFGGNQGNRPNIPAGITYNASRRFYEFGIATRDISSYLVNLDGGSTLSFAGGFARFKF
jgi:hypothetical protein